MSNLLYEAYNKNRAMLEERSFPSHLQTGARARLARRAEWNSDEEIETKWRLGRCSTGKGKAVCEGGEGGSKKQN